MEMKKKILITAVMALVLAAAPITMASAMPLGNPIAAWNEVDWDAINNEIDEISAKGVGGGNQNINVITGYCMEVPAETLRKLAGKNVTLAVHTGAGITVSTSGRELRTVGQDLKITVTDDVYMIPEEAAQEIMSGALYSRMFAMEEKDAYDIRLNIHFNLGSGYAGNYANLYHYDEHTGRMIFSGSYVITEEGMAMFPLSRGDEYILTITKGLPAGGRIGYTVASGDCLTRIAARNGVSVKALLAANPKIEDADIIRAGETIMIVK